LPSPKEFSRTFVHARYGTPLVFRSSLTWSPLSSCLAFCGESFRTGCFSSSHLYSFYPECRAGLSAAFPLFRSFLFLRSILPPPSRGLLHWPEFSRFFFCQGPCAFNFPSWRLSTKEDLLFSGRNPNLRSISLAPRFILKFLSPQPPPPLRIFHLLWSLSA